jgi:hypothetical protein
LLPGAADTDRIANRLAGADDQIKMPLAGFHHDGAGRVGRRERHQIAVRLRRLDREGRRDDSGRQRGRKQEFPSHRRIPHSHATDH